MYFITLPLLVRKIFTFYINDVLLFKCPFPWAKELRDWKTQGSKANVVRILQNSEPFSVPQLRLSRLTYAAQRTLHIGLTRAFE